MKTNITDVFFDLDHTLWDFDKNSEMAFDRIFKNRFPEIKIQDFIAKYAPINQECWKLYQNDKITHLELRYNRLKFSFDALNIDISDENINQIANDYIEFLTDNNHLFDGAIEVLDYLRTKYRLHIITNGFSFVQEVKLQKSNLDKYFVTITNSELAGHKKPHQNIFQYALSLANASKNQSIMVGDSIEADVLGAMNFGMKAVYFNPANEMVSHDKIIQIQKLTQLKNIL